MEHAQGMLWGSNVAPQHQIQLIELSSAPGNGGNGIVRLSVREGHHAHTFVGIAPPAGENLVCQLCQPLRILPIQPDDAHRPADNARLNVLEAPEFQLLLHRRGLHGEGIVSTLEVLMAEDRAAHNGQVGIGAHKIMGEGLHKVQQLLKSRPVDLHGHMPGIEHDAVLVVVNVGRILEAPVLPADGNRNNPMIGPGRMVHPAGVSLVLPAQLALGVSGLGSVLGRGNGSGILLRLTQVDGDVHLTVGAVVLPAHILRNPIAADVVGITAEPIVPLGGRLRALGVPFPEGADDLPGHGCDCAHNPGVENVPGGDVVFTQTLFHGVVQNSGQNFL